MLFFRSTNEVHENKYLDLKDSGNMRTSTRPFTYNHNTSISSMELCVLIQIFHLFFHATTDKLLNNNNPLLSFIPDRPLRFQCYNFSNLFSLSRAGDKGGEERRAAAVR